MNKPTPGPWIAVGPSIVKPGGASVAFVCGEGTSKEDDALAALIVAAVNACFKVNPENPLAVSEALQGIVTSLRDLITLKDAPSFPPTSFEKKIITWNQARAALAKLGAKP